MAPHQRLMVCTQGRAVPGSLFPHSLPALTLPQHHHHSRCCSRVVASARHLHQHGARLLVSHSSQRLHSARAAVYYCSAGAAAMKPPLRTARRPATATQAVAAHAATQTAQSTAAEWFAVLLGNAVLLGSLFRSLPQIIKVVRNGHAEGLSLTSNVVELLCFTIIIAYNASHGYAFNTFGEVVACWVQDVIIVLLIFKHMRASALQVAGATAAFGAVCGLLFWPGLLPRSYLDVAQAWNLVFMALGSRVPQVWMNFTRGNAGVLSLTTCLLNVAGNVARAFTTLVLTQDSLLLTGCVTQGLLNTIILGQVLHTRFGANKPALTAETTEGNDQGLLNPGEVDFAAHPPAPVLKPA